MLYLDSNPTYCAKATPIAFVKYILDNVYEGYVRASKESAKGGVYGVHPLAELAFRDICYSKKNLDWYTQYYNALSVIFRKVIDEPVPPLPTSNMLATLNTGAYLINKLNIHSPVQDEIYQDIITKNMDKYEEVNDVMLLSRLILFDMQPQFEDFIEGIPSWLTELNTEVLSAYDAYNRRHIKIEHSLDGENLRYFTAVISDNWVEIPNVPPEMDIIVRYLISNRANLALVDKSQVEDIFLRNNSPKSEE